MNGKKKPPDKGGNQNKVNSGNYSNPSHNKQQGLYNPIPGSEVEHIQEAITRYQRVMMTSRKLSDMYRQGARECDEIADKWADQATETGGLLLLAFKRKWALEDTNHEP